MEAEIFADQEPYGKVHLRQLFDIHGSEWVIAEFDGDVVGYALLMAKGTRATLFTFAVAEVHRTMGIGRQLLRHALRECEKADFEVLTLTVRPDNQKAIRVFDEIGFNEIGFEQDCFERNKPRVVMEYRIRH